MFKIFMLRVINAVVRRLIGLTGCRYPLIFIRPILQDRIFLENFLKNYHKDRVLFVGVDFYTCHYPSIVPGQVTFETIDERLEVSKYGARIHHECALEDFSSQMKYGLIVAHGVIGYGRDLSDLRCFVDSVDRLLDDKGELLISFTDISSSTVKDCFNTRFQVLDSFDEQSLSREKNGYISNSNMKFFHMVKKICK